MNFLNLLTKKFPQSVGFGEKILGADNFWGPVGHKTAPEISFNIETINFRVTRNQYHVKVLL